MKLAIFDWNGTLLNDRELAHACVTEIFRQTAPTVAPPTLEQYVASITAKFADFYYDHGVPRTVTGEEMNDIRRPHYHENIHLARLQPHATKLLHFCTMSELPIAIVSASPDDVETHLFHFGIHELFDRVRLKAWPKDQALRETAEHFDVCFSEAVYIDDTFDGLASARNIGMRTIGFTGGYNSRERIANANPDFIVDSLRDIIDILKSS